MIAFKQFFNHNPCVSNLQVIAVMFMFRIHFAGSETATVWCGFMNGAAQAGRRAAMEVIHHVIFHCQHLSGLCSNLN